MSTVRIYLSFLCIVVSHNDYNRNLYRRHGNSRHSLNAVTARSTGVARTMDLYVVTWLDLVGRVCLYFVALSSTHFSMV